MRIAMVCIAWVTLIATAGFVLAQMQGHRRQSIEQRFQTLADLSAGFTSVYVSDFAARERVAARRQLSGRTVSKHAFEHVVENLGAQAAVLLDQRGRLLHVAPRNPKLIGSDLDSQYSHLAKAVQGEMGISNVVPSAARGLPIAAVAIPYRAHGQRRVFSGAFEVSRTPLSAYMRSVSLGKNHRVFIIDAEGSIVAGSRPGSSGPMSLTDASLAGVTARPGDQRMETSDGQLVVVTGVANTPWRVVMAVPSRSLFEPVDGANRWLPWLVLLGIAILGFICVAMGSVMMARRRALDEVNAELERVSRTDDMTNLTNRRGIEETVGPSFAAAVRGNRPFSILMLDIDLLRSVNDSFGRRSGDQILIQASKRIATEMRASDMLGRWGGEEFIVVLIDTDLYAANESAERLRELIGSQPFDTDAGMIEVSVSIGVATRDQDTFSSLVERAEDALLRAKRAGRDLVLTA